MQGDALVQGLETQGVPTLIGGEKGEHIVYSQAGASHGLIAQTAEATRRADQNDRRVTSLQSATRRLGSVRRRLTHTGMQGKCATTNRLGWHDDLITQSRQ